MANADIVINCDENETKPKRRYTLHSGTGGGPSGGRYNNKRKRRSDIVLPTKFLLGGNINDPLNLASFAGKAGQITPQSSPLPTPKHKKEVEVLIPANFKDPLNLNSSNPEPVKPIPLKMRKTRKTRKRKRTDSETTVEEDEQQKQQQQQQQQSQQQQDQPNGGDELSREENDDKTQNEGESKDDDSVIPSKCPKRSAARTEIERNAGNTVSKGSGQNRTGGGPRKAGPSNDGRLNERPYNHHKPNHHHPRFNRGPPPQQTQHRFRPKDARFQYGNYDRYYGYRNQNMTPDPRLRCFKKEWFEDQDILDIGCNVGHVTLVLARDFNPKKIIGIDIDEHLIKAANRNIRHYVISNQNFLKKRIDTTKQNDSPNSNKLPATTSTQVKLDEPKDDKTLEPRKVDDEPKNTVIDETRGNVAGEPKDNLVSQLNKAEESVTSITESPRQTRNSETLENSPSEKNASTEPENKALPSRTTRSTASRDQSVQSPGNVASSSSSSSNTPNVNLKTIESENNPERTTPETTSTQSTSELEKKGDFAKPSYFPDNVQFICSNYVLESDDLLENEKPEYDCILCLSITKWIHLNFGDRGLRRAFKRMYAQLKPGGKLILEAQPWCSYKKKKYLTECTLKNYWAIKFKPEHFNEYLLSREVGFSTLELVDTPAHESKGFRRPIFLFRKAKEVT